MVRFLPAVAALLAVLVCGVVHGMWTDRWTRDQADAEAATRLGRLSLTLGDWEGQTLEIEPRLVGDVSGFLYRRYVNQRTGAAVTLSLACGRPGPVAIHTPDVCYVASGYEAGGSGTVTPRLGPGLPPGEFKTAQFIKTRATEQTHLRVFWSWNAGGAWRVSESPRFAFARYPVLYKLHLVRELSAPDEPLDEDPCIDLMQHLVPELQQSVISPS
jgi:uncharacterized protein DUF3485